MDEQQDPGITIDAVNLIRCQVEMLDASTDLQYHMGLTRYFRKESEDQKTLTVIADFDLMQDIEKPPCKIKCSFLAIYSRQPSSKMTWAEFSDHYTILHMVPYVREFVSSVTLRMPLKPLVLPPTNVHVLLKHYKDKLAKQSATAPE